MERKGESEHKLANDTSLQMNCLKTGGSVAVVPRTVEVSHYLFMLPARPMICLSYFLLPANRTP